MRIIIQRQKIDKKIKDNYQKDLKNEFKTGLILYKHCVKKKEMLNMKDLKLMKKKGDAQTSKKKFYFRQKEKLHYKKLMNKCTNSRIR